MKLITVYSFKEIDTTIDRPLHEVFEPFDWILYVSQNGDIDGLKTVHTICRETKRILYQLFVYQHSV